MMKIVTKCLIGMWLIAMMLVCCLAGVSAAEGYDPDYLKPATDELKPVPENQIRLPIVPPGPQPTPPPQPVVPDVKPVDPPAPQEVTDLKADQFFVIEADVPFFVLDSRVGLVSIAYDEGPIRLRGKFADGKGSVETRTYQSKYLATLEAVTKGQVEILVVPAGATDAGVVIRRTLTVMGQAPQPPPGPEPDPTPDPIVSQGSVLILYETSDTTIPRSQLTQITSPTLREYLDRRCLKSADGRQPEYRIWDKDVDTTNSANEWRKAVEIARGKMLAGTPLPILIVSNGTTGFSGPLPMTESETITLLKKYLGE